MLWTKRASVGFVLAGVFVFLSGCGDDGEVVAPPTITTHPSDQTVAEGQTATFDIVASGSGSVSYQWLKDTVAVPGAISSSYTTPATTLADDGAQFTCVVSNAGGSVESDVATLTVIPPPTITTHPANQTVTEGQTATFSVVATGAGTLTYQWRKNAVDIVGATSASYITPVTTLADDGVLFTCVVTNLGGSVTSNAATLTVNMAPPVITTHPANQTVTEGETATFSVAASGSGTLTYQWKKDGGDIAGATSASYTTPATMLADNGVGFTCAVTNAGGDTVSATAVLVVNMALPTITTQPADQTVTEGDIATFTVAATSSGSLTYQWQEFIAAVWQDISGETSASFATLATVLADDGRQFRCELTNPVGSVTSDSAALTVNMALPTITFQPAGQTVVEGQTATFIVAATSTGPMTYQWRAEGVDIAGATDATYVTPVTTMADDGTLFDCAITNDGGTTVSNTARLTVVWSFGSLAWVKRAGGNGNDLGHDVAVLSDDSMIVVGDFIVTATFGPGEASQTFLTSAGSYDIFVAKYNADGTLAWATRAGGSDRDYASGVAVLSDGSALVTGYFRDIATFGQGEAGETVLTSAGGKDIFVAKYNTDGTLAWVNQAGGAAFAEASGIVVHSGGAAVITGLSSDTVIFGLGEANETTLGGSGGFLAKYNADGTLAWAKRTGSLGISVATFSDDSIAVAGIFEGTATFGPGESNETILTPGGSFIARYNTDGTLAWAKRIVSAGTDVATLSDDSMVLAGHFSGSMTFGAGEANQTVLTSAGELDIFVARYDADGTLVWAKRAGSADGDFNGDLAKSIAVLSDDSMLLTGSFEGAAVFGPSEANETTVVSAGLGDIYIAKYNVDGTLAWVKRAGCVSGDSGEGVAVCSDSSAIVVGGFGFGDTATFGTGETYETTLLSVGGRDFFMARFDP